MVETNNNAHTAWAAQFTMYIEDIRSKLTRYHDEIKKNNTTAESSFARIIKTIEEFKESLKKKLSERQSQQKAAQQEQPAQQGQINAQAHTTAYQAPYYQQPPPSFVPDMQPIPVPSAPSM